MLMYFLTHKLKIDIYIKTFIVAILIFCSTLSLFAMNKVISWKIIHPISGDTIFLGEKGSVQEALIRAKLLPDPTIGMNEKYFDWIEEHKWTLVAEFSLQQHEIESLILELELPSVDTYAELYLNNINILKCNNAFLPYRIKINKQSKLGINKLQFVFTPPVLFHKKNYKKAKYKLPTTNDTHKIAIAPYTRKPQYQFGWDWTFRMNTIGLNKEVTLTSYDKNKIILTNIQTLKVETNQAKLHFTLQLAQNPQKNIKWNSSLFGELVFETNENNINANVQVKDPQLWWPKEHGEQFLYQDIWTLSNNEGEIIDQKKVVFGIRTVQLIQEPDKWGTSYQIMINNRIVFCKGGNYIPHEVFLSKITDSSTINIIDQADRANFNIIRIWGGGYYPDEIFYQECDRRGIMIWQDFMFACAMYPGTKDFLDNVKKEAKTQIPRIANHPSVVLFNGNNEVDIAWKHWGYQIKYGLIGKSAKEIKNAYIELFQQLLPKCVAEFSTIPYVHTSPLSHWGKDEYYRHGSQHYWGVWHGKDPIEDFGNKSGRFNAEYGFQSFPEYSTLNKVIDKKDWSIDSEVMKLRQKSYVGNKMIQKHADRLFGKNNDFQTFVYYSQLTQARALSIAVAAHRTDFPRCSGTIYWQLNDCWPAPTWSTIDYFGKWKAAHYKIKQDFKNVTILATEKTLNNKQFFIVSDWVKNSYTTTVFAELFDLNGKIIETQQSEITVEPQLVKELHLFTKNRETLNDYIIRITWQDETGKTVQRIFYKISDYAKKRTANIDIELLQINDKETTLVLTCDRPLIDCWIYSENKELYIDNNFSTLLPGKHTFSFSCAETLTLDDIFIRFL